VQGAVRPVLVVVGRVLAQDPPQMGLVPDEGVIQELAAASPDPAFGDRVHPGTRWFEERISRAEFLRRLPVQLKRDPAAGDVARNPAGMGVAAGRLSRRHGDLVDFRPVDPFGMG